MADEVVQGLNDIEVAKWNRQTVADGSWMQSYTLNPLSARDVYLANAIDTEIADRISADNELQDQIDTLEMSTDVVDIWGNYTTFTAGSATKYFPEDKPAEITFNDIIKVLNDEETPIIPDDPETTGHQTYWQLVRKEGSTAKKPTTANSEWSYIGYVDPYYSTHEVDNIIDELSSTIQDEYIPWSAQEGLVGEDNEFASNNVTAAWAFGKGNSANYGSLTVGQTNSASYGGSIGQDNKSNYGFAAGTNNTANSYSLAVGSTNSSYQYSLTVGNSNSANLYAGAIGSHVSAGTQSFAAGENTTAYQNSLAIGSTVSANTDTFSLGVQTTGSNYSIAVGSNVKAKDKSLAVGFNASANVDSIAVGEDNSANSNSIAIGSGNSANENSQAFGKGNVITNSGAVFGAYNKTSSNIAFVIGNGTGTAIEDRSDLFLIDKNGGVSSKSFSGVSGIFENISATNISATIKLSAESATINNATITNVTANNLSSTAISATNITALTATGQSANFTTGYFTNLTGNNVSAEFITGTSAKFDGYSGTNISGDGKNASIKNLIISAEGGSAANALLAIACWSANNNGTAAGTGLLKDSFSISAGANLGLDVDGSVIRISGTPAGIVEISAIDNGNTTAFTNSGLLFSAGEGIDLNGDTDNTIKISAEPSLLGSANSGKLAFNILSSTKFSANTTAAGYLSAGFFITGGTGVTIKTSSNNNNSGIYISAEGITGNYVSAYNPPLTLYKVDTLPAVADMNPDIIYIV